MLFKEHISNDELKEKIKSMYKDCPYFQEASQDMLNENKTDIFDGDYIIYNQADFFQGKAKRMIKDAISFCDPLRLGLIHILQFLIYYEDEIKERAEVMQSDYEQSLKENKGRSI